MFIMHRSWKLHCTPEATQRGCREKERERACAWGSAFTGVKGEGLGFLGLILYWWKKPKSGTLAREKRKSKSPDGQLVINQEL